MDYAIPPKVFTPRSELHRSVAEPVAYRKRAPAANADAYEPPRLKLSAEYLRERAWAEAHGVTITPGRVTVVAKRRGSDARSTRYEDELVVFMKDGTIARFTGTTKPAQAPRDGSRLVPDVNGDGKKDLGLMRPGHYLAVGPHSFGGQIGYPRPAFRVLQDGRDSVPAWRDTDGDLSFSAAEKRASERRGDRLGLVRIHVGFDPGGTVVAGQRWSGPWSVGCQNVVDSQLDDFVSAVGGPRAKFRYWIVEDR